MARKNARAVPFEIVKKTFPHAPQNSVPIIDVEQKKVYFSSTAAAEASDPPVVASTIFEKIKNPLNWRYRHATVEEVEQDLYLDSYDYLFDNALKEALNDGIIIETDKGYQFDRQKMKERREQQKNEAFGGVGVPQKNIDAAALVNSKAIIDTVAKKYYPSLAALIKEADELLKKGKILKRVHKTTIHNQINDPLNTRYRFASSEESEKECYLESYDYLFDLVKEEALNSGKLIINEKGEYRWGSKK